MFVVCACVCVFVRFFGEWTTANTFFALQQIDTGWILILILKSTTMFWRTISKHSIEFIKKYFCVFSLEISRRESEKAVLVRQASIVFPHLFGKRYAHLHVKTQNLTDICGIDISHRTSTKILSLSLLFFSSLRMLRSSLSSVAHSLRLSRLLSFVVTNTLFRHGSHVSTFALCFAYILFTHT